MLLLLYNRIGWSLACNNEVYALNLFFVAAIILIISHMKDSSRLRLLLVLSYVIGIAFAHHRLALLTVAGFLCYLIFDYKRFTGYILMRRREYLRVLGANATMLLLGLSAYLYLPIRAAQEPFFNWGNPQSWDNFYRHVMGWQYSTWVFNKSISEWASAFGDLTLLTVFQFPIILCAFAMVGLIAVILKNRKLGASLVAAFTINLIVISGYTIPEIDTYILPLIFIYVVWIAVGILASFKYLTGKLFKSGIETKAAIASGLVFVAFSISLLSDNRLYADRSDYRYADTQTEVIFDQLDTNAIILTTNWDIYSPLIYKQYAEGKRRDITAIDMELMRRSWFP